jgi:hypothetical protein
MRSRPGSASAAQRCSSGQEFQRDGTSFQRRRQRGALQPRLRALPKQVRCTLDCHLPAPVRERSVRRAPALLDDGLDAKQRIGPDPASQRVGRLEQLAA